MILERREAGGVDGAETRVHTMMLPGHDSTDTRVGCYEFLQQTKDGLNTKMAVEMRRSGIVLRSQFQNHLRSTTITI